MEQIISNILPNRGSQVYSLDEIISTLDQHLINYTEVQKRKNDEIDKIIKSLDCKKKLESLPGDIHLVQKDMIQIKCDIPFMREKLTQLMSIGNEPHLIMRKQIIASEIQVRKALKQFKFHHPKDIYNALAESLQMSLNENKKKLSMTQKIGKMIAFDWIQHQQILLIIGLCGKSLIDLEKLEKMMCQDVPFTRIICKIPAEKIEFNNLIEFQDTYTIMSLLDVVNNFNECQSINDFIEKLPNGGNSHSCAEDTFFKQAKSQFESVTISSIKEVIEMNVDYIEAHLTDGINIDKLNGSDNPNISSNNETLPLYAFSPQNYITQIGQHLLTLRKQIERVEQKSGDSLFLALKHIKQAQNLKLDIDFTANAAEVIMRCVSRLCISSLLARINHSILSRLTQTGRRQLATDAMYLDNVLEDLKLIDSNDCVQFKKLLTL